MERTAPGTSSGRIVVFGAGAIGRGLLGELAARSGMQVAFVEADPVQASALSTAQSYTVRLVGRRPISTVVGGYRVITPENTVDLARELASCRFAATAVGGQNLGAVASLVARSVGERTDPLTLVTCENWPHADQQMQQALAAVGVLEGRVHCAPCSVERMVQRVPGSLDLVGESVETAYTPVDVGLPGLRWCADFDAIYARKLYTNNAGHALLAYEGHLAGCETLCQALEIPKIRSHLGELLDASCTMLSLEHGLPLHELQAHAEVLIHHRFANRDLADRIDRVARQPIRKLGPEERLVGLLRRLQRHGLDITPVCRVIAAALHYFDPSDPNSLELRSLMAQGGAGRVLAEVCRMDPGEESYGLCVAEADRIQPRKETQ